MPNPSRLRYQLLPEDEVFVSIGPGMGARVLPGELARFCWGVLNDLDPEEAERAGSPKPVRDGVPLRLSPAASRLLCLLVKHAGRTVPWSQAEALFPDAQSQIVKVRLSEIRQALAKAGHPTAITTFRGEGVMLDRTAARECGNQGVRE